MARGRRPLDLTATIERVGIPAAIVDRNGIVTWANDAARELFGDVEGRPFDSIVAPEFRDTARRQRERKLRGGPATDYQVDVLTVDGKRRRAEISSVAIPGGNFWHAIFGVAVIGGVRPARPSVRLTPRQQEVLQLLAQGASTHDIAATLHLSVETVRNHVRHVLHALGAHSRLEAVVKAHAEGLVTD